MILSEQGNFPTDLYMAQGLTQLLGDRHELRLVDADEVHGAIDETVAVVIPDARELQDRRHARSCRAHAPCA